MGLLDELEQEAERRRASDAAALADREARERVWNEQLAPAMRDLAAYLRALCDKLRYLERRARVCFAMAGYGDVVAYVEPKFDLRDQPTGLQHEIQLDFGAQVASDECPSLQVEGAMRVRALSGVFEQHRLSGMQDARKNGNGEVVAARFQARGRIPMSLRIRADQGGGVARMHLVNLEGFGTSSRVFAPERLTPELFDALGRFLAREDDAFAREDLPADLRRQLSRTVERDQLKRQWEHKLARQLREDEARVLSLMSGPSRAIFGRLRLATMRLIGR